MALGGRQFIPRPPNWRAGSLPDWADPTHLDRIPGEIDSMSSDVLTARISADFSSDDALPMRGARDAAVLVPFHRGEAGIEMVFVKRPDTAPTHAGEVAFPGGMRDEGDADLETTALREAHEEIGLDPGLVQLVSRLPTRSTWVSRTIVTPWVGWVSSLDGLRVKEMEIESILRVPLADLLRPAIYHAELWPLAGAWRELHFFDIEGETIWGLTAAILRHLFGILFREEGHEQAR